MKYPFQHIKIRHLEDLSFIEEDFRKKRRGEILHLTLSFIRTKKDLQNLSFLVKKALFLSGEKLSAWHLEEDFIYPLKKIFALSQTELFFPPSEKEVKTILRERNFLWQNQIFRPDRVVIYPEFAVVVDFKTHKPSFKEKEILENYKKQIKEYAEVVSQVFRCQTKSYLLFIEPPEVLEVTRKKEPWKVSEKFL